MTLDPRPTRDLYDAAAPAWTRRAPSSLSDYTARPAVLALCEPVAEKRVLDLGCGEGYCARQLKGVGAANVLGIDLSPAMIEAARAEEAVRPLGIDYREGDARHLGAIESRAFDLVVCVFLFNYLPIAAMNECMREVARVLAPGGKFVFSVPHPAFPYLREKGPPFYFDVADRPYFEARDLRFAGKIWKRDGTALDVQLVHKTFEDYFAALRGAGFEHLPTVRELGVTAEMVALDPEFFGPLSGLPLHVAVSIPR